MTQSKIQEQLTFWRQHRGWFQTELSNLATHEIKLMHHHRFSNAHVRFAEFVKDLMWRLNFEKRGLPVLVGPSHVSSELINDLKEFLRDKIRECDEQIASLETLARDYPNTSQTEAKIENSGRENLHQYEFSFFKDGDFWRVGPYGRELSLKHNKGMAYIHFLLESRGNLRHVVEVYDSGRSSKDECTPELPGFYDGAIAPEIAAQGSGYLDRTEEHETSLPGKVIPEKKKKQAKAALRRLLIQRDETDDSEARQDLETVIEKYEGYLRDSVRTFHDQQEQNARTNVYNRIKSAKDRLMETFGQSAPELIKELTYIDTGYVCIYTGQAKWKLHK